jgi:RNA polymerase sigma-70 factor (ECF subfamily)
MDLPDATQQLVDGCLAGERSAQRELFRRHRERVHRTLYRVLGSNNAMDDLLQEVFVNVFRSLPTYRAEAPLTAWIDRIAVRVGYAFIAERSRKLVPLELVRDVPTEEPSAERRVVARDTVRRLYQHLARMDPRLRMAFTLHVVDERSLAEVAELMEASVMATKTRVWRARRELLDRAKRDQALAELVRNTETELASMTRGGIA